MSDKSILLRLEEQGQPAPRIVLRSESDAPAPREGAEARYRIMGEIARGGVGVVLRGRDNDLGREVALKMLRKEFLANPEFVRRFIEEAQVGAQLQHPGIVPVYELGLGEDQRPYFAMKLVKGETLAARLAERADPGEGRRSLLAIFREACRTVAYAHARGVIHRDLKPSNIMIGSFGEVQVVDWGFAKVLRRGGIDDERLARRAARLSTMIATVRTEDGSEGSVAGSVMGTPAYMPPEQALGHVEELDARSDVFCLGAILCEILTGSAPYRGFEEATVAALDDAHARLDACGADPQLVALARRAMAPLPKDRPANAQIVADAIAAYLAQAESRAHRMQVRAAKAQARADQQGRARRFARMVVAAGLGVIVALGGTYLWIHRQNAAHERTQASLIAAAVREARSEPDVERALTAAERARALGGDVEALIGELEGKRAAQEAAERLRERRTDLFFAICEATAKLGDPEFTPLEVDDELAEILDSRHLKPADLADLFAGTPDAPELSAHLFWWALRRRSGGPLAGREWESIQKAARALDPESSFDPIDPEFGERYGTPESARALSPLQQVILARRNGLPPEQGSELLRAAQRQHPDHFWVNTAYGIELLSSDPREAIRYFAAARVLRPNSLEAMHKHASALQRAGEYEEAIRAIRDAMREYPDWSHGYTHLVHCCLSVRRMDDLREVVAEWEARQPEHPAMLGVKGDLLAMNGKYAEAVECYRKGNYAVRAAGALVDMGDAPGAVRLLRETTAADPKNVEAWRKLGDLLARAGNRAGAEAVADRLGALGEDGDAARMRVLAAFRGKDHAVAVGIAERALTADSGDDEMRRTLAEVYVANGEIEKARETLAPALARDPEGAANLDVLADIHGRAQDFEPLAEVSARLLDRDPWNRKALLYAFRAAIGLKRIDRAVEHARALVRRWPTAESWARLAAALAQSGDRMGAREAAGEALTLGPRSGVAWFGIGQALAACGEADAAIDAFEKSIAASAGSPDAKMAWHGMYEAAARRGLAAQRAIAQRFTTAHPRSALAWGDLALACRELGDWKGAVAAFRKNLELDPSRADIWGVLGQVLERTRQDDAAFEAYAKSVELGAEQAAIWCRHGALLEKRGEIDHAIASYQGAVEREPDNREAWTHLLNAARNHGRGFDAAPAARWFAAREPDDPGHQRVLTEVLFLTGDGDGALAAARAAIRLDPSSAPAYVGYGTILGALGRWKEGADALAKAAEFDPEFGIAHVLLAKALARTARFEEALQHAKRGSELRAGDPKAKQVVERMQRYLEVDRRRIVPGTDANRMVLARVLVYRGEFEAALRLYADAESIPAAENEYAVHAALRVEPARHDLALRWTRQRVARLEQERSSRPDAVRTEAGLWLASGLCPRTEASDPHAEGWIGIENDMAALRGSRG